MEYQTSRKLFWQKTTFMIISAWSGLLVSGLYRIYS